MKASSIDNGRRVQVETTIYTGPAGLRETDGGGEFSAPGAVPWGQQAYTGRVDGRPVRILGLRPSDTAKPGARDVGMMVVAFTWDDAA